MIVNFIIAVVAAIALTYLITAMTFTKSQNKLTEELRAERNNALCWQLAAENFNERAEVRLTENLDAYQVVRGKEPQLTIIANFPRANDGSEALSLAEELADTINRFQCYAE